MEKINVKVKMVVVVVVVMMILNEWLMDHNF